ncbi:MAG: hypothetical protein CL763_00410 [Chloroflexi bacterium]|nr:hypothetical protein [Chloroflexota bacterium]|tara:strand:- start:5699 stop:6517 length:819 start_codon:yes stop_codon:yes gene_type:complete
MRLGIALPLDFDTEPDHNVFKIGATLAEENDFDSVWFFDSLGRKRLSFDPLIAASVAAAVTKKIEVGIGILQVPIRNPYELANRVLTSHLICEGRLTLGVGSGSTRIDFEAVGKNFNDRMSLLHNGLNTMQQLWNGEEVNGIRLCPASVTLGGPPIVIGSWAGPRWISSAANNYDGWIASAYFSGFDTLKAGIDQYKQAGGKRAIVTNISLNFENTSESLHDSDNSFHLLCDLEQAAKRLYKLEKAGFDDAVVVYRGAGSPDLQKIRSLVKR